MEVDLNIKTKTHLLKLINDCTKKHVKIKEDLLEKAEDIDKIDEEINKLLNDLTTAEDEYVKLSAELNELENNE